MEDEKDFFDDIIVHDHCIKNQEMLIKLISEIENKSMGEKYTVQISLNDYGPEIMQGVEQLF